MSHYQSLRGVFSDAVIHASEGKGKDRHASPDTPYEEQISTWVNERLGSNHFAIGQAIKKLVESTRLTDPTHIRCELLGALNYAATAVIVLDRAHPDPELDPGTDERDVVHGSPRTLHGIVENADGRMASQCREVGCVLAFDHRPRNVHENKLGGQWTT